MFRSAVIVFAVSHFLWTASADAQLVSIRCCTEESHLAAIADCVSGSGNLNRPATCPPGAACVLGFGENTQGMASLCDPKNPEIPPQPQRGYCSGWENSALPILHECVARPNPSVSLFSVFDDDGDGDLDDLDVAAFEKVYETVPNLQQSEAALTYVRCCAPRAFFGLSGPGVPAVPLVTCIVGFSKPIQIGDYLFELCGPAPTALPEAAECHCVRWQDDSLPPVFFCPAAEIMGNMEVIVADADDDGDVDLEDFAAYQREAK